jgi:hypothetical protein
MTKVLVSKVNYVSSNRKLKSVKVVLCMSPMILLVVY